MDRYERELEGFPKAKQAYWAQKNDNPDISEDDEPAKGKQAQDTGTGIAQDPHLPFQPTFQRIKMARCAQLWFRLSDNTGLKNMGI